MKTNKSPVVRLVKKYRVGWAWATLGLYVLAIPVTLIVFPDNNRWLALLVLFSGLTATLATLADMLVNAEEAALKDDTIE